MTNNKKIKKIILSNYFEQSISSRSSVINLFKLKIDDFDLIRIDFENIEFLSRSVVHQFLEEKKRLKKTDNVRVEFYNENEVLIQLFNMVEQATKHKTKSTAKFKSIEFTSNADLSRFLLTV